MNPIELALITLGAAAVAVALSTYICAWLTARPRPDDPGELAETICVLKPLCGEDDGLLENLCCLLEQSDDNFEVVMGSADPGDPALAVARAVQERYPHRQIKVVSGSAKGGANPKVRLLRALAEHTTSDWLLISDSNVRPTPDYLSRMRQTQHQKSADLVHCLLSGAEGRSTGERLEDLQLSGWVAPTVCFTDTWGHPCVVGKSMLLRSSSLCAVGGLEGVRDVLAEDYVLGRKLSEAGYKVALCPYVLPVINRGRGLRGFVNRHVRWGQMRRHIAPGYFLAELGAQPLLFLGPLLFSDSSVRFLAAFGLCLKWFVEAAQGSVASGKVRWLSLPLLPLKDALVLLMWAVSLFKTTVNWRGSRMRVLRDSVLVPLDQPAEQAAGPLELARH
jgi:ceramide glucosyltransferase